MVPLFLALSLAVQVAGEGDEFRSVAFVEQSEGRCSIRQFGRTELEDGIDSGLKVWFGQQLALRCSLFAHHDDQSNCNAILMAGTLRCADVPMYGSMSFALFDADDNLLVSEDGGIARDRIKSQRDELRSFARSLIPLGVEKRVYSYKVAYFESRTQIKNSRVRVHHTGTLRSGEDLPLKNDGDLRSGPFKLREMPRKLPEDANAPWSATTFDGTVMLRDFAGVAYGDIEYQKLEAIGQRIKCTCKIARKENAIEVGYHFTNSSEKNLTGAIYVAFFDRHGNLVVGKGFAGPINAKSSVPPNGKGRLAPGEVVFSAFDTGAFPRAVGDSIAAYKMTLYEFESCSVNGE